jgi:hypothetical protein
MFHPKTNKMLQTLIFKTNGKGIQYPYGPKKVITFKGASKSIQIYKTTPFTTKIHITSKNGWNEAQMNIINFYQKAGYRLNILQHNDNIQLNGFNEETTINILKTIYISLMECEK